MRQAITLLEKQIEENALEMKILAFEHIRCEGTYSNNNQAELKRTFLKLEQQNIALEKAIDAMLEVEQK